MRGATRTATTAMTVATGGIATLSTIGACSSHSSRMKTASGMEQARIGFTTMLGSAQKADVFLKQLQKFAAATPFEFPELTKASQRLIAMGIDAKQVIPYMTAIGDAVAGLGGGAEQIDQVTTAIGQMSAKGKIQSDELLQLTEAGIPALKILAAQYHVSAGAMQDMVTKGKVLSADALPKLIDGLEHGTKSTQGFGGMMEKQSHSLAGMWSTLKDNVSQALAKAIAPAFPLIEKLVGWLSDKLPMAIGKAADWLGRVLPEALDKAKTWMRTHQQQISDWKTELGNAADKVKELAGKVVEFAGKLISSKDDVKHFAEALTGVVSAVSAIKLGMKAFSIGAAIAAATNPVTIMIGLLFAVAAAFVVLYTKSETFRSKVNANRATFAEFGAATIQVLLQIGGHALVMAGYMVKGVGYIIGWWHTMLHVVLDVFAAILHGAAAAFGWIPGLGGKLKDARDGFDTFSRGVDTAMGGAAKAAGVAGDALVTLGNSTIDAADKAGQLRKRLAELHSRQLIIQAIDRAKPVADRIQRAITQVRGKTVRIVVNQVGSIQAIQREINNLTGKAVSITIGSVRGPNVTGNAHGGIVGAAGGGPRSGMFWAGEQGPELVSAPAGSRVYTAGESARMATQ